jgi:hypothetical protein
VKSPEGRVAWVANGPSVLEALTGFGRMLLQYQILGTCKNFNVSVLGTGSKLLPGTTVLVLAS